MEQNIIGDFAVNALFKLWHYFTCDILWQYCSDIQSDFTMTEPIYIEALKKA